jgi:hypothetical protein
LDIPFVKWSELITDDAYRQQLYEGRLRAVVVRPIIYVTQWLQGQFEHGWQMAQAITGLAIQSQLVTVRSKGGATPEDHEKEAILAERTICNGLVRLVVDIKRCEDEPDSRMGKAYRVQIYAVLTQSLGQPQSLLLRCIESDEEERVVSTPDDSLMELLPQIGQAGESFTVVVRLGDQEESEQFRLG